MVAIFHTQHCLCLKSSLVFSAACRQNLNCNFSSSSARSISSISTDSPGQQRASFHVTRSPGCDGKLMPGWHTVGGKLEQSQKNECCSRKESRGGGSKPKQCRKNSPVVAISHTTLHSVCTIRGVQVRLRCNWTLTEKNRNFIHNGRGVNSEGSTAFPPYMVHTHNRVLRFYCLLRG